MRKCKCSAVRGSARKPRGSAPDLADQLSYLLIDSRGMNLRDDVAHGILPHGPEAEPLALLCILILLTLSVPHAARGEAEPVVSRTGHRRTPGSSWLTS